MATLGTCLDTSGKHRQAISYLIYEQHVRPSIPSELPSYGLELIEACFNDFTRPHLCEEPKHGARARSTVEPLLQESVRILQHTGLERQVLTIVSCVVGCRAEMNQKKMLVGNGPGTETQPVYCSCVENAVVQALPVALYVTLMFGSTGEAKLERSVADGLGNRARHDGI